MLTNTSSATRFSPARFSSTASSSVSRLRSMPFAMRWALPYMLVLTSACTSTSSGREPSMQHSTADPGVAALRCGEEQLRRVGHRAQPVAGHLEHPEFADGAEAVLHRAHDPIGVVPLALEVQDGVDDVLEHLRARRGCRPW